MIGTAAQGGPGIGRYGTPIIRPFTVKKGSYLQLGAGSELAEVIVDLPGAGPTVLTFGSPVGPVAGDGLASVYPFRSPMAIATGNGQWVADPTVNGPVVEVCVYDCAPLALKRRARAMRATGVKNLTSSQGLMVEIPVYGRKRTTISVIGVSAGANDPVVSIGGRTFGPNLPANGNYYGDDAAGLNDQTLGAAETAIVLAAPSTTTLTVADTTRSITLVDLPYDTLVVRGVSSAAGTPTMRVIAVTEDE